MMPADDLDPAAGSPAASSPAAEAAAARSVHPVGRHAVVVDVADARPADLAHAVADRARSERIGLVDLVPGARSVLVSVTDPDTLAAVSDLLLTTVVGDRDGDPGARVDIEVRYDGADLAEVADRTGMGAPDVVELHSSTVFRAAFSGFAPGFCYLTGLPATLRLPRRDSPRHRVPAGSVAIADEFSAVYPRESPGGWWLIGTTSAVLWNADRTSPASITPGDRVRFVPAGR